MAVAGKKFHVIQHLVVDVKLLIFGLNLVVTHLLTDLVHNTAIVVLQVVSNL